MRPGDCLLLTEGQTCTVDGTTAALEPGEALVVLCPPPNEEVMRAKRKAAQKAAQPRRQSFTEEEVGCKNAFDLALLISDHRYFHNESAKLFAFSY